MLQPDLESVGINGFAIKEMNHNIYGFEAIKQHTFVLYKMLEFLEVNRDEVIGIYNKSNYENICCMYACLLYGANFTIIDGNDSENIWLVKKPLLGVDLLLSDFYKDNYIVTIDPTYYKVNTDCAVVRALGIKDRLQFRENLELFYSLVVDDFDYENSEYPVLDMKKLEQRTCAVYHKGATVDAFKTSVFSVDRIVYGIENSIDKLEYEGDKVLYMETFDLLYDIVNGVINPLSKGKQVLFADTSSYENTLYSCMNLRATDMYVNAFTLEKILDLIIEDLPDWVTKLKGIFGIDQLFKLALQYKFRKIFGKQLKHLVVVGKIRKPYILNCLSLKITTVYAMTEVASFITCKSHKKLKKDFSVGKIDTENVLIVGKRSHNHGGIMIYSPDMAVTCIPEEVRSESYINHSYKGRLWTKDIGYIDSDDELHVINKSSLIFEMDNGKLIMTGEMLEIALSKQFVREALIVKPLGDSRRLVMLIEPNIDYVQEHGLSYEQLQFKCNELRLYINKRFKGNIPLTAVEVFTDPEGLSRDTFKILSRQLTSNS